MDVLWILFAHNGHDLFSKKKKKVWAWQIFEEEVEGRRRKGRELRKKV